MAAIKEYGPSNFRDFPTNLLPGRNIKQIRNRYNNVLKNVGVREHWNEKNDIKLMELVEKYGTSDWANISKEIVYHNRTSCRQRYTTVKRFLEKNPSKTIVDVPRRKKAFSSNVTTDNWMETIIREKTSSLDESFVDVNVNEPAKQPNVNSVVSNEIGRNYYDYFKYSYDFQYGKQIIGGDSLFENIQIACQLLQAPIIPNRMDVYSESFSDYVTLFGISKKVQLESGLLKSLIQLGKKQFMFPVNLNTILGLRGIVGTFESETSDPIKMEKIETKPEPMEMQQHDALDLFKARFLSIFQNTARLSKLTDLLKTDHSEKVKVRESRKRKVRSNVTSTKDFDNNSTLVRVVRPNDPITSNSQNIIFGDSLSLGHTINSSEISDCKKVTILESITLGMPENSLDRGGSGNYSVSQFNMPFDPSVPSTSSKSEVNYSYTLDLTDGVYKINVEQCDSMPEQIVYDNQDSPSCTELIVWDPTQSEDEIYGPQSPKRRKI